MAAPEPANDRSRPSRAVAHPAIHVILPLTVIAITVYLLHKIASHIRWADVRQSANRNGIALDLMGHDPSGPSFVTDALFREMMLWAKDQGFHCFSLGAARYSRIATHQLASLWNRIGSFCYENGEHFHRFEGLCALKQEFDPTWTPNYLASRGGLTRPRSAQGECADLVRNPWGDEIGRKR